MLRVTIKTQESGEIWELEGKLSGEWVGELDRLWKARPARAGITTEIHLKAVSYVDAAGKQVLTQMRAQGAEIRGCGCMTRAVVEEIMREKSAQDAGGSPKRSLALILLAGFFLGGSATLCAQQRPPMELMDQNHASQFGIQFHNGDASASFLKFGACIPIFADHVRNEEGGPRMPTAVAHNKTRAQPST